MLHEIFSVDDERVLHYRNLKDRRLRESGVFICEGRFLTERLLESGWGVDSVFIEKRLADEFQAIVDSNPQWDFPVYVAHSDVLSGIVGFDFHRGVLSCGLRSKTLCSDDLISQFKDQEKITFVVCPEVNNLENLGSIFRTSAGLGGDAIILGENCSDPLSRRVVRVSMGTVFSVPFVKSDNLKADLAKLADRLGIRLWAGVLDKDAQLLDDLSRPDRLAIMFGNEADGLGKKWLEISDKKVTVPMQGDVDSLNLSVAAGIFMYQLRK